MKTITCAMITTNIPLAAPQPHASHNTLSLLSNQLTCYTPSSDQTKQMVVTSWEFLAVPHNRTTTALLPHYFRTTTARTCVFRPKGAMITDSTLRQRIGVQLLTPDPSVVVSYMPLAHSFDRINVLSHVVAGSRIGFHTGPMATIFDTLRVGTVAYLQSLLVLLSASLPDRSTAEIWPCHPVSPRVTARHPASPRVTPCHPSSPRVTQCHPRVTPRHPASVASHPHAPWRMLGGKEQLVLAAVSQYLAATNQSGQWTRHLRLFLRRPHDATNGAAEHRGSLVRCRVRTSEESSVVLTHF
jgi:hypothetical protein